MNNKKSFKYYLFKFINLIFRVKVINAEKEPECGYLLCANHISNLDPVIIVSSFKNKVSFMAKKELFKVPFISSVIKIFGAFPVDRGSVDLGAMKKAISLLEEKNTVGMFPQGTRCKGHDLRKTSVKRGAGMIVHRAMCDILPVAIITKDNKCRLFGKKYVVIGDIIKYESLKCTEKSKEEFERISGVVFEKICDLYDEYSYLVNSNNG